MDHQEFVQRSLTGSVWIGVDPAGARKFFTALDPIKVCEETGYDCRVESQTIRATWALGWVALLAVLGLSVFSFRWGSVIAVPGIALAHLMAFGQASIGKVNLPCLVFLQVMSTIGACISNDSSVWMRVWLLLLPTPLLLIKLTYFAAAKNLRIAVLHHERLYSLLLGGVVSIRDEDARQ